MVCKISAGRRWTAGKALALLLLTWGPAQIARAQDSELAIVNAIVESSEDGPAVSPSYKFLPGDFVYCSFQIAGFHVQTNRETEERNAALSYEVTMQDAKGTALSKAEVGEIKIPVHAEDKNWVPKRRTSFLIPSFVAAGVYRIHLMATDILSEKTAAADVPFAIGGTSVEAADTIAIQHFSFLREEDGQPLTVAAYRPGDTVFILFDATNFKLEAANHFHIGYGVVVEGPDGKPFLEEPNAAQLEDSTFYGAQFLPCRVNVLTKPSSLRGAYVVTLTLTDLISKKSRGLKQTFTLE